MEEGTSTVRWRRDTGQIAGKEQLKIGQGWKKFPNE